jgi:putative molybdopterin biosynthesis protein
VPVAQEPYDLVTDAVSLEDPLLAPLWRLLDSPQFHASVEKLGGYGTHESGQRIR